MYAIIDVAGQQFKVEKGQKIYVHRLDNAEGSDVNFDSVLLIDNDGKITIGEPVIKGAFVEGKVLTHLKGDKVIVFKKKRRKGYKVKNGHRQQFSHVEILSVNEKGAPAPKTAKASVSAASDDVKATSAKKDSTASKPAAKKPAAKTAEKKESTAKKPAAKKATAASTAGKKESTAKKPAAPKASTSKTADKKESAAKKPAAKPAAGKTEKAKAAPKKDKAEDDSKE